MGVVTADPWGAEGGGTRSMAGGRDSVAVEARCGGGVGWRATFSWFATF
jgi:hypothetical protein